MVYNESNQWNTLMDNSYNNIRCLIVHDYNIKANLKLVTQLKLIVTEPKEILQNIFMWL